MNEVNSKFIVTGEVCKSFKPRFYEFVRELNRRLCSYCENGDIGSVTFKFKVIKKEVICKDE